MYQTEHFLAASSESSGGRLQCHLLNGQGARSFASSCRFDSGILYMCLLSNAFGVLAARRRRN